MNRQRPPLPDSPDTFPDVNAESEQPATPFPMPEPLPPPVVRPSMVLDPKKPGSEGGTEG